MFFPPSTFTYPAKTRKIHFGLKEHSGLPSLEKDMDYATIAGASKYLFLEGQYLIRAGGRVYVTNKAEERKLLKPEIDADFNRFQTYKSDQRRLKEMSKEWDKISITSDYDQAELLREQAGKLTEEYGEIEKFRKASHEKRLVLRELFKQTAQEYEVSKKEIPRQIVENPFEKQRAAFTKPVTPFKQSLSPAAFSVSSNSRANNSRTKTNQSGRKK